MPLREHHREAAAALCRTAAEVSAAVRPGAAEAVLAGGEPEYLQWGDDDGSGPDLILATIGAVELEYAAIRRGVGLIDAAQGDVIELRGADAKELLGRIVTQKVQDLGPYEVCDAFLLRRTGRILADMTIVFDEDGALVSVDRCDHKAVVDAIDAMVFTEDVSVEHASRLATIEAHGPAVSALLEAMGVDLPGVGRAGRVDVEGVTCLFLRDDRYGEVGVRLFVPRPDVLAVWRAMHAAGEAGVDVCRTVGWYAVNMARLESATPRWHIDFGPTSLPYETGLL